MKRINVYGQDHSPWVQSVLLALHEQQISYRLTTVPTLSLLVSGGVMMPALRFESDTWIRESTDILYRLGYEKPTTDESKHIQAAWQGVVHRSDHPGVFFQSVSWISDPEKNSMQLILKQLFRGFIAVYFFLLLVFVRFSRIIRNPDNFVTQFKFWNDKLVLTDSAFIDGDLPGQCDLQLFGIVQCHSSIPSPVLTALISSRELARLRRWIEVMQLRFHSFPHMYSGTYFKPNLPAPTRAAVNQRVAFWAGVLLTMLFFPLTLPVMAINAFRTHYPAKLHSAIEPNTNH